MRNAVLLAVFSVVSPSASADEGWWPVATTEKSNRDETRFEVKLDSIKQVKNSSGQDAVVGIFRVIRKGSTSVELNQVLLRHCEATYGTVVTMDTEGRSKTTTDFAFGAGNVAAAIAENLCVIVRPTRELVQKWFK